jgi:hypothetical protein
MTDERKPKFENLEVNRETVADLSEPEAEQAKGGLLPKGPELQAYTRYEGTCTCPVIG